jgi:hypothetical protein
MDGGALEIAEANLTIVNGSGHVVRAERIARLMFDYVRELMERDLQHLGRDVSIAGLDVPPIEVNLEIQDDEAIARAGAEAVRRALIAAV